MKRSVGPGVKISLDDLYEQYGVKHSIEEGEAFVDWLRNVKLKDVNVWEIKFGDELENEELEAKDKKTKEHRSKSGSNRELDNTPSSFVEEIMKMTVEDVTMMSVRTAREKLPRISDMKLLKYSLHQASQLANKDTLCRMLKKRIQELELTSRT